MKHLFIILFFLPLFVSAQAPLWPWNQFVDTNVDYGSAGEYFPIFRKASTHQAYNNFNQTPQLFTGQPTYVANVFGGPHDCAETDQFGNVYFYGSIFNTSTMTEEMVDSAGNAVPPVRQVLITGNSFSPYWTAGIVTTTGEMGVAGQLQGGMRGNGTVGSASQIPWVWVPFPAGTFIEKITGGLGWLALDSAGNVWSCGFNGTLQLLMRGSSPSPGYESMGMCYTASGGVRAVDIASTGQWSWILLSNGHILCSTYYQLYAGVVSTMTPSYTPYDNTTWLYSHMGGTSDTVKKIRVNNAGTYFINNKGQLYFLGDQTCGAGGNGLMVPWNIYNCCPFPVGNGSDSAWYNFDQGVNEYMNSSTQTYPTQIAPGVNNWADVDAGTSNCWYAFLFRTDGRTYAVGRDKSNVWCLPTIPAAAGVGSITGNFPDSWDMYYAVQTTPFSWTVGNPMTCPRCILYPSSTYCNTYTNPSHTPRTPNFTGYSSAGIIYLNGTSSGSTPVYSHTIYQTNPGSDPAVLDMGIQMAASNLTGILDTISTAGGSAIPSGTYHFTERVLNTSSDSTFTNLTVVVGATPPTPTGPIPAGVNVIIVSLDSVWSHSVLCPTAAYVTADTLSLPPNSSGVFNLSYMAYDTVQKYTGVSSQTVLLSRGSSVYGSPYISYNSPYVTTGLSTHQASYNILGSNNIVLVQVCGYGLANPIRWHIMREQKISPL